MDQESALFLFPIGQRVRWAGAPTYCYWISQRRWTERAILGPIVEYALCRAAPHDTRFVWVYEADLTPWDDPDGPSAPPHSPAPTPPAVRET